MIPAASTPSTSSTAIVRRVAGERPRWPVPWAPFACVAATPHLVWQLTRREILARYRGSFLGLLWSFVTPALTLLLFTFVFSVVFHAGWNRELAGGHSDFTLVVFPGFIVFWLFSDCIARAPGLIVSSPVYVKKIVFPLHILPWVVALGALFNAAIGTVVFLLVHLVLVGLPPATALLFPLVLVPLVLLALGISWTLAALGVFYRDVGQLVGLALMVLLNVSPILYPISRVPDGLKVLIRMNPLSVPVEMARSVLLWGERPDWSLLAVYTLGAWFVAWLGFAWFERTRRGFADVL